MPDPRRDNQPDEIPTDLPDAEINDRDLPEGPIPGMPFSRDPLREPGPTVGPTEKPPLD
jgi:hypothetical protein